MTYVVQHGDSLWSIAQRFGISVKYNVSQSHDGSESFVSRSMFVIPTEQSHSPAP